VALTFDPSQLAALDAVRAGNVVVSGGPGTGKTTVAVEAVVQAVEAGVAPERVVLLAPSRTAAARLRDRVSLAVNRPTGVALVRTPASLAFAILSRAAAERDEPAPSLITGAEQDVILRELLEGHRLGAVRGPDWEGIVAPEALELPGFREELRNVMNRAAEADVQPHDLADLAVRAGRPEWIAAAHVYREYLDVLQLRSGPADAGARFDPAAIVARAADQLHESAMDGAAPPWDLLVVDDFHDVTAATGELVGILADAGTRVLVLGNADQTVESFRGALPHGLSDAVERLRATHHELAVGYRQSGSLARVGARLAARISVAGQGAARDSGRAHAVAAPADDGSVEVLTAPHAYAQSRAIAARLREARHGRAGAEPIGWSQMVVIARSRALLREIRSDLTAADIPCESFGDGVALHMERAVAPLLTILRVALGEPWTEESALAVLGSRLGGLDPVALRRLRRELLREERAGGGERSSVELLLAALGDPARLATVRGPEARLAVRIAKAVRAAQVRASEPAATPGAVLWAAWAALGVADEWREAALAGSSRDDADLDAVIALMRAAQTYTERLPTATALAFLEYVEAQDFAADVLGARAQAQDAVQFATPATAVGREWDVVVVAGLNEGVWPNLRLRDSVLGSQRLAEALAAGPGGAVERARGDRDVRQARREVLDDETRSLLVAVSRARSRLIVTSVDDGEQLPSRFVPVIEAAAGVSARDAASQSIVADLRSVVARLRADAAASLRARGEQGVGQQAVALAKLAALGEGTADPANWYGVAQPSTAEGFWEAGATVRVSPSRYDSVRRCPLRWALETVGGTMESSEAQNTGLLVHALAEKLPRGTAEELLAAFDDAWGAPPVTLPERTQYDKTRQMVVRLAGYIASRGDVEVLVEQPFRVVVDSAELSGIADRIERGPDGVTIVDLKTGRAIRQADAEDHGQLKLYQLAANHGGFAEVDAVVGAQLVFVGPGAAAVGTRVNQSPIDDVTVRAELADVVRTMTSAGFDACVNETCGSCPVARSCPAQAQGAQVSE
jgi:superfamily I DNA/RNA helicase/RecB family exonuclease